MTVFLLCEPSDSFNKVKQRIVGALAVKGGVDGVKLYSEAGTEYVDEAMVGDFPFNDATVLLLSLNGEAIETK
jgi:hypothetical protein